MLILGPVTIVVAMAVGVLGLFRRGYELLVGIAMLVLLVLGVTFIALGLGF